MLLRNVVIWVLHLLPIPNHILRRHLLNLLIVFCDLPLCWYLVLHVLFLMVWLPLLRDFFPHAWLLLLSLCLEELFWSCQINLKIDQVSGALWTQHISKSSATLRISLKPKWIDVVIPSTLVKTLLAFARVDCRHLVICKSDTFLAPAVAIPWMLFQIQQSPSGSRLLLLFVSFESPPALLPLRPGLQDPTAVATIAAMRTAALVRVLLPLRHPAATCSCTCRTSRLRRFRSKSGCCWRCWCRTSGRWLTSRFHGCTSGSSDLRRSRGWPCGLNTCKGC